MDKRKLSNEQVEGILKQTTAQIEAKKRYRSKTKQVAIEFNLDTDAELFEFLSKHPKQAFIKSLLKERKNMEEKAVKYVAEYLGIDVSSDITVNQCRNGRYVAWYLDDSKELCVYIDTLEHLSEVEIEKEDKQMVRNEYDVEIDFNVAVNMMDDEIREELHNELAPCEDQVFFDAYAIKHLEKFGEEWELAKQNPCY